MTVCDILYFLRFDISYSICIFCKNANGSESLYLCSYTFKDLLPKHLYDYVPYDIEFNKKESLVKLYVLGEL